MSLDLTRVIRLKGAIDATLSVPTTTWAGARALVQTYDRVRVLCLDLIEGSGAEAEFLLLFPADVVAKTAGEKHVGDASGGDVARSTLAQLSGWLGSWPSAEQLLDELIVALETAEAETDDPAEKTRLRGALDTLRGAGREIAIGVVTSYLERVHV